MERVRKLQAQIKVLRHEWGGADKARQAQIEAEVTRIVQVEITGLIYNIHLAGREVTDLILLRRRKPKGKGKKYYLLGGKAPSTWVGRENVQFLCTCGLGVDLIEGEGACEWCEIKWSVATRGRSVRLVPEKWMVKPQQGDRDLDL